MKPRTLGKRLLRAVLTPRAARDALTQAERDWPDSRGLLERLALGLRRLHRTEEILLARLASAATGALAAHRAARKARLPERERFAAFVGGIADALDASERPVLERALTAAQRRVLGGRLGSARSDANRAGEGADA
jgi:hypothetical protein